MPTWLTFEVSGFPKNIRSPLFRAEQLPYLIPEVSTALPRRAWAEALRGRVLPFILKQNELRPLQSKPFGDAPPHRYGMPKCLRASSATASPVQRCDAFQSSNFISADFCTQPDLPDTVLTYLKPLHEDFFSRPVFSDASIPCPEPLRTSVPSSGTSPHPDLPDTVLTYPEPLRAAIPTSSTSPLTRSETIGEDFFGAECTVAYSERQTSLGDAS